MRWHRNLQLSIRALTRSWLRTLLSASGVAIGIASVVVLIGAGAGAEQALRSALEELGENLLVVSAALTTTNPLRGASRTGTTLTIGDWQAIDQEVEGVVRTAPVSDNPRLARANGWTVGVRLLGTTPQFQQIRNLTLVAGRFIDEEDLLQRERVAVVGALVVEEIFQGESPVGETLFLGNVPFRIVGVTKKKGVSYDGANEDEVVVIPLTTAMRRLAKVDYLDRISIQAESEQAVPVATSAITSLLRYRHANPLDDSDDFSIQDQDDLIRARQDAGRPLSRVVTGLSALALGLGGVGLLAVSLLSVRERYSEIGLRLAIGGRPRDILLQFFTEAILISALGGAAGLALGVAGIWVGGELTQWPMVLSWQAAVYPFSISLAIAVVFGAYPALRAARLDPILALNSR